MLGFSIFSFISRPGSREMYVYGRYREDQVGLLVVTLFSLTPVSLAGSYSWTAFWFAKIISQGNFLSRQLQ